MEMERGRRRWIRRRRRERASCSVGTYSGQGTGVYGVDEALIVGTWQIGLGYTYYRMVR